MKVISCSFVIAVLSRSAASEHVEGLSFLPKSPEARVPAECNPINVFKFDAMKCFQSVFFSGAGDDGSWLNQQKGQLGTVVKDTMKKCAGNLAQDVLGSTLFSAVGHLLPLPKPDPFDDIICDVMKAVYKKDKNEVSILKFDQCVANTTESVLDKSCAQQIYGGGGGTWDILKSVMSAVTGGSDSGNPMAHLAVQFKECLTDKGKDNVRCLSEAFVSMSVEGYCRATDCEILKLKENKSKGCQEAVISGCPALYNVTNMLVKFTGGKVDGFALPQCSDKKCPKKDGSLWSLFGGSPSVSPLPVISSGVVILALWR